MAAAPAPSTLPPPPPPPAAPLRQFTLTSARRRLSVKGSRLLASTLLLFSSILLAVSMGVSWWSASSSGGGKASVVSFLPGSQYWAETAGTASTPSYLSAGLLHVGQLYEAVLVIGIVAIIAGFAGMLLSYVGALGGFKSRKFLPITLLLTLVSFVGAVVLPTLVAAGQPGAFTADNTSGFGGTGCGASPTPCTSFWNSITNAGVTVSWGADVGWYLAIAAAVLLVVALLLLWTTRRLPYTRAEMSATPSVAPAPATGQADSSSVPPAAAAPVTDTAIPATTSSYCPKCGNPMTYVAQYLDGTA